MAGKSLHRICRWTFNPGKGGFVPGDLRPEGGGDLVLLRRLNWWRIRLRRGRRPGLRLKVRRAGLELVRRIIAGGAHFVSGQQIQ